MTHSSENSEATIVSPRPLPPPRLRLLCCLGLLVLCCSVLQAAKFNRVVEIGEVAPRWPGLPGVDGKTHKFDEFRESPVLVVFFLRNHCPVTRIYQERLLEFVKKYRDKGVAIVALNVSRNPGEDLLTMKKRAEELDWQFPYLKDESQQVGRNYGATNTPHVFVLDRDRKIVYMGAIDDANEAEDVTEHYLDDAVTAVLQGRALEITETRQRGCEIDYANP